MVSRLPCFLLSKHPILWLFIFYRCINNNDIFLESIDTAMFTSAIWLRLITSFFIMVQCYHSFFCRRAYKALNEKACELISREVNVLASFAKPVPFFLPTRDISLINLIYHFILLLSHWLRNCLNFFSLFILYWFCNICFLLFLLFFYFFLNIWLCISLLFYAWLVEFRLCSLYPLGNYSMVICMTCANTKCLVTLSSCAIWYNLIKDKFSRVIWPISAFCGYLVTLTGVREILSALDHLILCEFSLSNLAAIFHVGALISSASHATV